MIHPSDILNPESDKVGPVGVTVEFDKFDVGFYEKIQALSLLEPDEDARNVYDGVRYYDTIIVVSRDDGDSRSGDETASENKDAIVKRLQALGAINIISGESLSFVTASIPITDVPGVSLYDETYKIGDGEILLTTEVDMARITVHATAPEIIGSIPGTTLDGTGVIVAIVDSGINSQYLNDKVIDRIYCPDSGCDITNGIISGNISAIGNLNMPEATHGTQVAQILAASGMTSNNGFAPGVQLLDAKYDVIGLDPGDDITADMALGAFIISLDWAYTHGADISNISAGFGTCASDTDSFNLMVNEAVDKGMVVVKSAGNNGLLFHNGTHYVPHDVMNMLHNDFHNRLYPSLVNGTGLTFPTDPSSPYVHSEPDDISNFVKIMSDYESVSNPGCTYNPIVVGGIYDRDGISEIVMFGYSNRGPTMMEHPILVPHVVAPAVNIQVLNSSTGQNFIPRSGTSFAAPQVSATAAMLLQDDSSMTPAEIKSAILLGADWQGPIPCSSPQYELVNDTDMCSHAMQPANPLHANNADSIGILNNVGFGILNVNQTLQYAISENSTSGHVLGGHLTGNSDMKQYNFVVSDTSEPVKVLLTWMAHPHGNITEQVSRSGALTTLANLDFKVNVPNGDVIRANSALQSTEFAVFMPASTGTYTVTVSGTGIDTLNKPVQNYAIASTHILTPITDTNAPNSPPVAQPKTVIMQPGLADPVIIRLQADDADGDPVSFSISSDPSHGTVTVDEFITSNSSRVLYFPDSSFQTSDTFQILPHDGLVSGTAATITIMAETLPTGSTMVPPRGTEIIKWDTIYSGADVELWDDIKITSGPDYLTDAIFLGSVNMEESNLRFETDSGTTYTAAISPSGIRMIQFATPLNITSATLYSGGPDEESYYNYTHSVASNIDIRSQRNKQMNIFTGIGLI